ncbi:MAG: hypothetical protein K0S68_501, partial [Candidatus Saccharibacteria bacterium]|nr:hypothetical protein [Candidatus Saccharibacteria bacterium]
RQQARFMSLFGVSPAFTGVHAPTSDLESAGLQAAGHLVDALDAALGETVVLVNVASRGGHGRKKWPNGTPFCWFRVGDKLVASTYEGAALSLVRDLGLVSEVQLLDIPHVVKAAVHWGEITPETAEQITNTQFRSLEFLPRVAKWVHEGRGVPAVTQSLDELPDVQGKIWYIDNFGNAKTTRLPEEIGFDEGRRLAVAGGHEATCYQRLADVPDGETALVIGSSGFGERRFVELVIQRRSAARELGLAIGQDLLDAVTAPR